MGIDHLVLEWMRRSPSRQRVSTISPRASSPRVSSVPYLFLNGGAKTGTAGGWVCVVGNRTPHRVSGPFDSRG